MAVLLQGREELTAPLLVGPGGKADIEVVPTIITSPPTMVPGAVMNSIRLSA